MDLPESHTDEKCGEILLKKYIAVHLNTEQGRFRLINYYSNYRKV